MEIENENRRLIEQKYAIEKKIGSGGYARVYLVKEDETGKLYAAKLFKKDGEHTYEIEKKFLEKVKNTDGIINLIDAGEGSIIGGNKPTENRKYLILDYAEKGSLHQYITGMGLKEEHAKLIFYEILKRLQALHEANICHRDLNLNNILLDKDFNLIITDFGFASEFRDENGNIIMQNKYCGTDCYIPPEIRNIKKTKEYDGSKADVFSLGATLIQLVIGKPGFKWAIKIDDLYKFIFNHRKEKYWEKIEIQNGEISSQNLKNLFIKMVEPEPNLRPTIDDILDNDEWIQEIKALSKTEYEKLREEVNGVLKEREKIIEEKKKVEAKIGNNNSVMSSNSQRAFGGDKKMYFNPDVPFKYVRETGLDMSYLIKINGELNPNEFMNILANKVENINENNNEENEVNCFIEASEKNLKFIATFIRKYEIVVDDEEENPGQEEEEDSEIEDEEIVSKIQVKLFGAYNGGYIILLNKKEGNMFDFDKNFEIIKNLVNQIL